MDQRPEHPLPAMQSRKVLALMASVLILLPAAALVSGVRGKPIENRASKSFNGIDGWASFSDFGAFVADRIPLRSRAVRTDAWIDDHVFSEDPAFGGSSTPRVIRGKDGFLFLADAIDTACAPNSPPDVAAQNFSRLSTIIADSGRDVLSMVAPDKSTVHPELLPADLAKYDCFTQFTNTLWSDLDSSNIPGFVNLRSALSQQTKATREPLYLRKDSHWDSAGSLVGVHLAIDHFAPGLWSDAEIKYRGVGDYTGDLTGMQGNPQTDQAPQYSVERPDVIAGPTTVIDDIEGGNNRRFTNSAPPGRLIPGKSLMFLDSYGLAALPQLVPFFEDLTIIRLVDFEPSRFAGAIADADRVWVLTVERSLTYRLSVEIGSTPFLDQLQSTLQTDSAK